jgi:hypothetical protein
MSVTKTKTKVKAAGPRPHCGAKSLRHAAREFLDAASRLYRAADKVAECDAGFDADHYETLIAPADRAADAIEKISAETRTA